MKVNPTKGLSVLSEKGIFLSKTKKGTEVPRNTYYRRLLKSGDIEVVETKTVQPKSNNKDKQTPN